MNLRDAALGEVNILGLWLICYYLNLIMVLHVLKSPFNGLSFHKSFEWAMLEFYLVGFCFSVWPSFWFIAST